MAIQIERLKSGHIGYKVASYGDWNPYIAITSADDSKDWSGLYVALSTDIAKGYRTDGLSGDGYGTAFLHEVKLLNEIDVVVCDDPKLHDESETSDAKAKLVKSQLASAGIDIGSNLLIPSLGAKGYFFKGYHDKDNMELIVPNKLADRITLMKSITYSYQNWCKVGKVRH